MDDRQSMLLLQQIRSAAADAAHRDPLSRAGPQSVKTAVGALLHFHDIYTSRRDGLKSQTAPSAVASELEAQNRVVAEALPRLHACISKLEAAIQDGKEHISKHGRQMEATAECMSDVIVLSHKLSYSSFAPLGRHPSPVYGPFAPPAPTEQHMQFSQLQEFAKRQAARAAEAAAAERAQAQAQADASRRPQAAEGAAAAAPTFAGATAEAWRSLALPAKMPADWRPPPGWKPGDPIPMAMPPPGVSVGPDEAAAAPLVAAPDAPPAMNFDMDSGIEFDFVLNAETVESEDDDESESEMEDDD